MRLISVCAEQHVPDNPILRQGVCHAGEEERGVFPFKLSTLSLSLSLSLLPASTDKHYFKSSEADKTKM